MSAMDTLLSMKVFRQVVESGSFVEAAERLNLSTAMTSKHLMYLERCKVILEEVTEAELAVGSVSGVPRGMLRVTAPSWGATRLMVDLLAAYRQRYPEV